MIELIFVIVILGILAVVAIPKLAATRTDAHTSVKASAIMAGATEIASYAVAKGATDSNLSVMSNSIAKMQISGDAVVDNNKSALIRAGSIDDCVTVNITQNATDDILQITFGNAGSDQECTAIQSLININDYPITLRGRSVAY